MITPIAPVDLVMGLGRLDELLRRAAAGYPARVAGDDERFRGLYLDAEQVAALLTAGPMPSTLYAAAADLPDAGLGWLSSTFHLAPFDVDLVLLALAPEVDGRYERLYAYLQDDVTRRRPTVGLALDLLCASPAAKLAARARLAAGAPLLRHRLLHLLPAPNHAHPTLLSHDLVLDGPVIRWLLGDLDVDPELAGFCTTSSPASKPGQPPLEPRVLARVEKLVRDARRGDAGLCLMLRGRPGSGREMVAETLARAVAVPLLMADLPRAAQHRDGLDEAVARVLREAVVRDALLCLDGMHDLSEADQRSTWAQLIERRDVTILAVPQPWSVPTMPFGATTVAMHTFDLDRPSARVIRAIWALELDRAGRAVSAEELDAVADRLVLTPAQIRQAATQAAMTGGNLLAVARGQTSSDLAGLAVRVDARHRWDHLVLPADVLIQLRELCGWVVHRRRVGEDWDFGSRLMRDNGPAALFAGPSGAGKTMAAGVVAGELGLDLYRIDLSAVVSKYIGETEKNLDRVFGAAQRSNAILFLDDVDSLAGKRSEVRDAHDRYANIEIAYLLQRLEAYPGTVIMASNLRQNIDEAFTRRLAFVVHFPFPEAAERRRIWHQIWPDRAPLADDIDLATLAARFPLTGGSIRNVALSAAFLAAEHGGPVRMQHVHQGLIREFAKLGKTLDLGVQGPATDAGLTIATREVRVG